MKWGFLLSFLVETFGAVFFYFQPHLLVTDAPQEITKLYALAAFSFGFINFLCYKNFEYNLLIKHLYLVTMFFHAAVSFLLFSANEINMPLKTGAVVLHLGVFIFLTMCYLKNIDKFK